MPSAISVTDLSKTYASGFRALKHVDLEIRQGEIFALLGPNGAGKTTLINIICGLTNPTEGTVRAAGHDIVRDYRAARALIGLVPQELPTDIFATVRESVRFSRGLFGLPPDPGHIETVLKDLSLWDKKDEKIITLSGGMKRRLLIAKALAHEPRILFLDEPTAGVDVERRQEMWRLIRRLRANGVTVILTTHYLEEAEALADRVGVIREGEIILVEETAALLRARGRKQLTLHLPAPLDRVSHALDAYELALANDGSDLVYSYGTGREQGRINPLFRDIIAAGVRFDDLRTDRISLEDIFVDLLKERR